MRVIHLILGLACLSCSSSGASSSVGDASADDAGNNTFSCGNGTIKGTAHVIDPQGLGPVPGATVSAPGCTTAITDDRGYISVATDPSFVMKVDLSAPNSIDEHVEFQMLVSGATAQGALYESNMTSKLPGWSASQGYLLVLVQHPGVDGGPCATNDGVTLSVNGHPEIAASYLSDPLTIDPSLKSTGAAGFAFLGPVPPGTYEVDGAKPGCSVSPFLGTAFQFETTTAVSAGTLTVQELKLAP